MSESILDKSYLKKKKKRFNIKFNEIVQFTFCYEFHLAQCTIYTRVEK